MILQCCYNNHQHDNTNKSWSTCIIFNWYHQKITTYDPSSNEMNSQATGATNACPSTELMWYIERRSPCLVLCALYLHVASFHHASVVVINDYNTPTTVKQLPSGCIDQTTNQQQNCSRCHQPAGAVPLIHWVLAWAVELELWYQLFTTEGHSNHKHIEEHTAFGWQQVISLSSALPLASTLVAASILCAYSRCSAHTLKKA